MKNGEYELMVAPDGYPGKQYRGRYAYVHRVVWWQNTGELLDGSTDIHHKDENKRNNAFLNLEKLSGVEHRRHHARRQRRKPWLLLGSQVGTAGNC